LRTALSRWDNEGGHLIGTGPGQPENLGEGAPPLTNAELMQLHIGYEAVEPWPLTRADTPDTKARAAGQAPKCVLKSLPDEGRIAIDSETTLSGIPPQAWHYKLGNRSALDWVLDQHKERKPKDPTIREKFDTYRFADHKERVITLLARVVRVSVETVRLVDLLRSGPR